MILTNELVFVHLPKTGGTFVRHILTKLDEARIKGTWLSYLPPKIRKRVSRDFIDYDIWGQPHRCCRQIPPSHRLKPILATLRNPYDRYVSAYEFGCWRINASLYTHRHEVKKIHPHFPDLTFTEFVHDLTQIVTPIRVSTTLGREMEIPFGWQTWQFVNFFFKEPTQVLPKLSPSYAHSKAYLADMYPIHFIRTHHLNQELYDFLIGLGYHPQNIDFILTTPKILPRGRRRNPDQNWKKYYTPELKRYVRKKEDFIFTIFPEFDV
ncbi:hypothetical protein SPONN_13 [uncultured Candidatus Thioglobus sp.]|nr:hypothetical protein SPONN_13 [uncultured Candidatus Thioglobus sp.]